MSAGRGSPSIQGCQSPGSAAWLGLSLVGDAPGGTLPPAPGHWKSSSSSFIPWMPCSGVTRDTMDVVFQKKSIFFPVFVGLLRAEPCRKQ